MADAAKRAKALFLELLELPEEGRLRALAEWRARDPGLADRVRRLLEGHRRAGLLSELASTPLALTGAAVDPEPGEEIGDYRVIEKLGEGGFGSVFRAEQLRPLRRSVALKLIRAGRSSAEVLARFAAERRLLARMDHPAIARVIDAGETPDGRPFFAMELVRGEPITHYARARALPLAARLELVREVCSAIQHAHAKGVLHRDIKPSNVLVQEIDGRARAKVIDFGLAKVLVPEDGADGATHPGAALGTPAYAAPEQVRALRDVDTRADVYGLGALLYELVTGRPPLGPSAELASLPLDQLLERVLEAEPQPPSRLGGADAGLAERLPRELDWILLRALDKERERRYPTAFALERDIERLQAGEPVEAAPPSRTYRMRKAIGRHRLAFAGAAAAFLALLAGSFGTGWGLLRARERAEQAEQQVEVARALARFLVEDLIRAAAPGALEGAAHDVSLRGAVMAASGRLAVAAAPGGRLATAREVVGRAHLALGEAFGALGEHPLALAELEQARAVLEPLLGAVAPEVLEARVEHAGVLVDLGRAHEALAAHGELLPIVLAQQGPAGDLTLTLRQSRARALRHLGELEASRIELAAARADAAAAGRSGYDEHVLALEMSAAVTAHRLDRLDEAETLFRRVLEARRSRFGDEHPATHSASGNLGAFLRATGRRSEARSLLESAHAGFARVSGPDHPNTFLAAHNLAGLLLELGRADLAHSLLEPALETAAGLWGEDQADVLRSRGLLGLCLERLGEIERAGEVLGQAYERTRRVRGEHDADTLARLKDLAGWHYGAGRLAQARDLFERLFEHERALHGPHHPIPLTTRLNLGLLARVEGDLERAASIQAELEVVRLALPSGHPMRAEIAKDNFALRQAIGEAGPLVAAARAWREEVVQAPEPDRELLAELEAWLAEVERLNRPNGGQD